MFRQLERILAWLKKGYPSGIPEADYLPLLAILRRRLSDDEIKEVGDELSRQGLLPADRVDVGVVYLRKTDELASPNELERVGRKLSEAGWPLATQTWPGPGTEAGGAIAGG